MPEHHLFLTVDPAAERFRVPLSDVQEVISLQGVFGRLDPSASHVQLRKRTVRIVQAPGTPARAAQKLVVFVQGSRLHGLPVRDARFNTGGHARELNLKALGRS